MSSVYWIHHPEHTDMFSQGYIGISEDTKRRFRDHQKKNKSIHIKRAIEKYGMAGPHQRRSWTDV